MMIGIRLLKTLNLIHNKYIVHRDLKPENLLTGNDRQIFLIDFGLSKRYIDTKGVHIPRMENKSFRGTLRYCSINMHMGVENSRRDDLESLGYVLIFFLKGKLPWQGIRTAPNLRAKAIAQKKIKTSLGELCSGLPNELMKYMKIVRDLGFDEKPDYHMLEKLLENAIMISGQE